MNAPAATEYQPPIHLPEFWMEVHEELVAPVVASIYAASPAVNFPRFPRFAVLESAQSPCLMAWVNWMKARHPDE